MKRIIKPAAIILSLLFVAAMCACGSGSSQPATKSSTDSQADLPVPGVYTVFGMSFEDYPDYVIDSAELLDFTITLDEDGTGVSVSDGETYGIESWKYEDGKITLVVDGEATNGTLKNGILIISDEDYSACFVKEGADKSSIKLISVDEFEEKLQEDMPDDEAKDE